VYCEGAIGLDMKKTEIDELARTLTLPPHAKHHRAIWRQHTYPMLGAVHHENAATSGVGTDNGSHEELSFGGVTEPVLGCGYPSR